MCRTPDIFYFLFSPEKLHSIHVAPFHAMSLADLMNGPIKKKLGIPANVTWGGK